MSVEKTGMEGYGAEVVWEVSIDILILFCMIKMLWNSLLECIDNYESKMTTAAVLSEVWGSRLQTFYNHLSNFYIQCVHWVHL